MYIITLNEKRYTKNPQTKTTYILTEAKTEIIDERQYNNYIDSMSWFRRMGGTETAQRAYTCAGYNVYKLTSKSPDKQTKVVREFSFKWVDMPRKETEFKDLSLIGKYNSLKDRGLLTDEVKDLYNSYKFKNKELFTELHNRLDSLNK